MAIKIDYTDWTQEEIQSQIQKLSIASPLTYRRLNHMIELGDGFIRISSMQEDRTWSDWETIETPNLHVTEGKIIAKDDDYLMIRVSYDKSYEICSIDDDPWTNDEGMNCFNSSSGGLLIAYILSGMTNKAKLLTTRTTIPDYPFQVQLATRMKLSLSNKYRGNVEQMYIDADKQYEKDAWIKYFPYNEKIKVWTPKQEIYYLTSLLDSKLEEEKNKALLAKRSDEKSQSEHKVKVDRLPLENMPESNSLNRNYVIAALFAILFGGLGVHKFYMGKYLKGILYLFFCWTWIPSIIGIFEGIKYLIDGQEKFNKKLR